MSYLKTCVWRSVCWAITNNIPRKRILTTCLKRENRKVPSLNGMKTRGFFCDWKYSFYFVFPIRCLYWNAAKRQSTSITTAIKTIHRKESELQILSPIFPRTEGMSKRIRILLEWFNDWILSSGIAVCRSFCIKWLQFPISRRVADSSLSVWTSGSCRNLFMGTDR